MSNTHDSRWSFPYKCSNDKSCITVSDPLKRAEMFLTKVLQNSDTEGTELTFIREEGKVIIFFTKASPYVLFKMFEQRKALMFLMSVDSGAVKVEFIPLTESEVNDG